MAAYSLRGSVAIISVNNPPVNALSAHVRKAIEDGIERAESDANVSSIILCGAGNKFLAGADIKEFSNITSFKGPSLVTLCNGIEACEKPVIAVIERYALGGGLEVALSSHYRIAHPNTVFGFPEIDLGILPGATGTQRFPRLVGLKAALHYISTGERFPASKAKEIGLVDKIVDKDLLEEAIKFADDVKSKPVSARRTSQMKVKDAAKARQFFEASVERAARKSPGLLAPTFAIKAVMASTVGTFEQGLEAEANFQAVLFTSGQARALQYAFFAERAASQWSLPGGSNFRNVKSKPIRSVGVIGGGTMGTGIAMSALNAGLNVIFIEQNQQFLAKAVEQLKKLYQGSVRLGKLSKTDAEKHLSKLQSTVNYESLKDVDLVIEAVYENLKLKQEIFAKLDQICKSDAVLCTNTSGISIDKIASATKTPERVIGTHFFVPAYHMKLLENVRGLKTSPSTIATATAVGLLLRKVPVLVGNCEGFAGNRMMKPYTTEAIFLVEEGCTPEVVDQVAEDFGFPIGPFKVSDLSGIDIGVSRLKEVAKSVNGNFDEKTRYFNGSRVSALSLLLYNQKRYGRKTSAGWYNYEHPGAKTPYPSDVVNDLISEYRKQNGIPQRKISSQEIIERLLFGLINEGFKILEEGIAQKPEELDTIWLLGYSWPRQTGGPMFYANSLGLDNVYSRILEYSKQHVTSPHWKPSPLLQKLAKEKTPISKWHSQIQSTVSRL